MSRPGRGSDGPGLALPGRARHASPLRLAPLGAVVALIPALSSRLWAGPRAIRERSRRNERCQRPLPAAGLSRCDTNYSVLRQGKKAKMLHDVARFTLKPV